MLHPNIFIIDMDVQSGKETAKAITDSGYFKSYAVARSGNDAINYLNGLDGHDHFPHIFFIDADTMEKEGYFFLKEYKRLFEPYAGITRIFSVSDKKSAGRSYLPTDKMPIEGELTKPLNVEIYDELVRDYLYVE